MSFSQPPIFKEGLTQEEKSLYSPLFRQLDPEGTGIVLGEKARNTFEKSGLPPNILGEIWQIADVNNLGFLTQFGFCLAMRLIGQTQAGNHPTSSIAEYPGPLPKFAGLGNLDLSVQPSPGQQPSGQHAPVLPQLTNLLFLQGHDDIGPVSPQDSQRFSQLFIRTVGSAQGLLPGAAAKDIFLKAKLPTQTLGQIWNLVDQDNSGLLGIQAFVIAMHLIHAILLGRVSRLPSTLPVSLWRSSSSSVSSSGINSPNLARQSLVNSAIPSDLTSPTQLAFPHQGYPQGNLQTPPQGNPLYNQQQSTSSPRAALASSMASSGSTVRHPPASSSTTTSSSLWTINPTLKLQYESVFDNLDKSKSGTVSSEQMASVLMLLKLLQEDLAVVWDLADIQNTGIFTKTEFIIALFLVNKRMSGEQLPNIIPEQLIESIGSTGSAASIPVQQHGTGNQSNLTHQLNVRDLVPPVAPAVTSPTKSKTNMDDLVDIFGSLAAQSSPTHGADLGPPSSSLNVGALPKVRKTLTGFNPTLQYGQQLMKESTTGNLLGESPASPVKVTKIAETPESPAVPATAASAVPQSSGSSSSVPTQKSVNYDALRSVPPPPRKSLSRLSDGGVSRTNTGQLLPQQGYFQAQNSLNSPAALSPVPRSVEATTLSPAPAVLSPAYQPVAASAGNNDLLADSEVSRELSQATTDIANVSNQIKSLTSQTTSLQDKKQRAEQELSKILVVKTDIEAKLKQLKTSYGNEVKLVEQVEQNLVAAREEAEALRSQCSISEARFHALTTELNEKQLSMEGLQKENATTKEKLGTLNAEIVELEKQVALKKEEGQKLSNQVNVRKLQAQVAIVKVEELKSSLRDIEAGHQKLAEEYRQHEQQQIQAEQDALQLQEKVKETKKNAPTPPASRSKKTGQSASASGLSAGAVGGIAAGVGAVGAGLGAVGSSLLGSKSVDSPVESDRSVKAPVQRPQSELPPIPSKDVSEGFVTGVPQTSSKDVIPEGHSGNIAKAKTNEDVAFDDHPAGLSKDSTLENKSSTSKLPQTEELPGYSEAAPLNEFSEVSEGTSKEPVLSLPGDFPTEKYTSGHENVDSVTAASTTSNASADDFDETPRTSPNNLDFQFPQGNSGIAGSMVGMPGVLIGVLRTESLTSSVQNNAALSVRDDNISVSDHETLQNALSSEQSAITRDEDSRRHTLEDLDKLSSGVGSFELVNADDAVQEGLAAHALEGLEDREAHETHAGHDTASESTTATLGAPSGSSVGGSSAPGGSATSGPSAVGTAAAVAGVAGVAGVAAAVGVTGVAAAAGVAGVAGVASKATDGEESTSGPDVVGSVDEVSQEFPPIRELDVDESDSLDETLDDEFKDKFDDAVDHLPSSSTHPEPDVDFDSAFDELEPAAAEKTENPVQSGSGSGSSAGFGGSVPGTFPGGSASVPGSFPPASVAAKDDLFGDFDGLEEARPEADVDEFAMDQNYFTEDFTNQENHDDGFPSFGETPTAEAGDDEWEQLFAGFGNAGQAQLNVPAQSSLAAPVSSLRDVSGIALPVGNQDLVDELVGMGFDSKTAAEALARENGDLEAATNYLLDHA